jgi:hypothetical protein
MPEQLTGRVADLNMMFVVLVDEEGDQIHIPSNLIFQRVIRRKSAGEST